MDDLERRVEEGLRELADSYEPRRPLKSFGSTARDGAEEGWLLASPGYQRRPVVVGLAAAAVVVALVLGLVASSRQTVRTRPFEGGTSPSDMTIPATPTSVMRPGPGEVTSAPTLVAPVVEVPLALSTASPVFGAGVIRPDTAAVLSVAGAGNFTVYTTLATEAFPPLEVECISATEGPVAGIGCGGSDVAGPLLSVGPTGSVLMVRPLPVEVDVVELEVTEADGSATRFSQRPIAGTALFVDTVHSDSDYQVRHFDADGNAVPVPETSRPDWIDWPGTDGRSVSDVSEEQAAELRERANRQLASCLAPDHGAFSADAFEATTITLPSGRSYEETWPECRRQAHVQWLATLDQMAPP